MEKSLDTYLDEVASAIEDEEMVKVMVDRIEKGIKTTKGNYGKYMQLLSPYVKEKAFCLGMAQGLKRLGANAYGVDWAIKILLGNE